MSIIDAHQALAQQVLPEPALYIGGDRVTTTSTPSLEKTDPTTGSVLSSFPVAGSEEVDQAVRAARSAYPAWKRMSADERRRILWRIAEGINSRRRELCQIAALETGSPISSNEGTVAAAADHFEYYAGWSDKFEGELISSYPGRALNYVRYEPYGVVGAIVTWNGPVLNAAMKIAPALAAGNCVVLKSPELAPFATMLLAEICLEAGLPEGVLNVLSGDQNTSKTLIDHPDIRKVSFTGGPEVASQIMARAALTHTPVILELGGKSANIVFADADLDAAAQMATVMSVMALSGQGCLFPTRLLVEESVYDEMIERVELLTRTATLGDPLDERVSVGPVISEAAATRVISMVDSARHEARVIVGGNRADGELRAGAFVYPTVIADVRSGSALAQKEVFGPVLAISKFRTEADAISEANGTQYGLAAYLHTRDLSRAHRVADDLEAGWVGVNSFPPMSASAPFGGTKSSGFGREGGRAGIEDYVHHKNIYVPF